LNHNKKDLNNVSILAHKMKSMFYLYFFCPLNNKEEPLKSVSGLFNTVCTETLFQCDVPDVPSF